MVPSSARKPFAVPMIQSPMDPPSPDPAPSNCSCKRYSEHLSATHKQQQKQRRQGTLPRMTQGRGAASIEGLCKDPLHTMARHCSFPAATHRSLWRTTNFTLICPWSCHPREYYPIPEGEESMLEKQRSVLVCPSTYLNLEILQGNTGGEIGGKHSCRDECKASSAPGGG